MDDVETSETNPFASPVAVSDKASSSSGSMSSHRIGRWLFSLSISGGLNAFGIALVISASMTLLDCLYHGVLDYILFDPSLLAGVGIRLAVLAITGGILGSLSGLLFGAIAFFLRQDADGRNAAVILGYLLPCTFLLAPTLLFLWLWPGRMFTWNIVTNFMIGFGGLWVGWRLNAKIDALSHASKALAKETI